MIHVDPAASRRETERWECGYLLLGRWDSRPFRTIFGAVASLLASPETAAGIFRRSRLATAPSLSSSQVVHPSVRVGTGRALFPILFAWIMSAGLALAVQADKKDKAKVLAEADYLFSGTNIPSLSIEISGEGIRRLRRDPREYVPATVKEGAMVYTNVAIHLKGGPGSFRAVDDTPGFTLNFDHLAEGQRFHGLKKMYLNNSVQDRSYLSERTSRQLFEAAGVPVPRAANAMLTFNGSPMGMYVLLEGVDKQFLHRYFKDVSGNVYDGHSGSDVVHPPRVNSGDDPNNHKRLRALAQAAQMPDLDDRWDAMKKNLDVDRFLSFVATEIIVCHWDGYALNRNNFRMYDDHDADKIVFLPHGLDQTFQHRNSPILPPLQGLVARSLLEIPEARALYMQRVAQLLTNVFDVDAITNRVRTVSKCIDDELEKMDPQEAADHARLASQFCRRIRQRLNDVRIEMGLPADPLATPNPNTPRRRRQPQP